MDKIALIITNLRKAKGWSQSDLSTYSGVSREMISKYERALAIPSVDAAKKIADAFAVSLDYLVGEGQNALFDKRTLERIEGIEKLEQEKRQVLFDLIDTYIRDCKARQTYAAR